MIIWLQITNDKYSLWTIIVSLKNSEYKINFQYVYSIKTF